MRAFTMIVAYSLFISPAQADRVSEDDMPGNKMAREIEEVFSFDEKENLGVNFVVGNDLWLPGERFEDGTDWLALVCNAQGCNFQPAALSVKPDQWQGHYDDEPTSGQRLTFTTGADHDGEVTGWFQEAPAFRWLEEGVATTYHSSRHQPGLLPERSALEVTIHLPNDETARLVPLLAISTMLNKWQPGRNYSWPRAVLQLRSQRQRQLLPGDLGTCSGLFHPRNYLLWAGDLDKDDKPDYLISYIDADGPVHLFLSTAASADQLVGLGGIYDSPPHGGECDGPEGFLYFDEVGPDGS
ncbi:MAG: hypothetical protein KJO31_09695 [Gammaproteobacteria bacterium]|nr:hypothetical protein [Gammaproteobacteria bacterium]